MVRIARVAFIASLLFAATRAPAQSPDLPCLRCHEKSATVASAHASVLCAGCHAGVDAVPHATPVPRVDCSTCHPDAVAVWSSSLHGAPRDRAANATRCEDCHGAPHAMLASSDPKSPTSHAAIPGTCERCHALAYRRSVHGAGVARGVMKAPVCTDCHDAHGVRPASEPRSSIFKFNVPRTCGRCHAIIAAEYDAGVHGQALARGTWSAPVCTDCHGIHTISHGADAVAGPARSCPRCHESVQLAAELGSPVNRVATYRASYHGLARRLGSKTAADCASCHGAHRILPSSDPRSAIHPANLAKTCGKCHPGAQTNFTRGKVHLVPGDRSDLPSRLNTWIRWIYTAAIAGTVAFMLAHNVLMWWRKAQRIRKSRTRTVVRMNRNQRAQHFVLLVSFFVLAISGFALAWPDSLFAKLCGSSEELRRLIHRVAAVAMMAIGVYHLGYVLLTAEGRQLVRDIRVRFGDLSDLLAALRYALGISAAKPAFGRFSYGEKIEYWAGLWGSVIMSITGVMLWFPVVVTSRAPRWWLDIATTIHLYEAILATSSIVVWHLYHVIFDPDVYPMNWSWLDGTMDEERYREEHGRE